MKMTTDGRPPLIDYASPADDVPDVLERWALRPLSWRGGMTLLLLCTGPLWLTVTNPQAMWWRWGMIIFFGGWTAMIFAIAGLYRGLLRRRFRRTRYAERRGGWRFVSWFAITAATVGAFSMGWPMTVLFWLHRPLFDAAYARVAPTLAPESGVRHGRIGLFHVTRIRRNWNDSVAFDIGNGDGGFVFQPTSKSRDHMYFAVEENGPMGGGWYWEASD